MVYKQLKYKISIYFIILFISAVSYSTIKYNSIKYITVFDSPLVCLQNYIGVCYLNSVLQLFYTGYIGKYFIEHNFKHSSFENNLKEIFLKMRNGSTVDLQRDYIQLFKHLSEEDNPLQNGGYPIRTMITIITQLYKNKDLHSLDEFNDIFKGILAQCLSVYKKINNNNYPRLEYCDIYSEIKTVIDYFSNKNHPKIICLIFPSYKKLGKETLKEKLKLSVDIMDRRYVLRSIGIAAGDNNKAPTHICTIIKGKEDWFLINDQLIKKIKEREIFIVIESVLFLFYELENKI